MSNHRSIGFEQSHSIIFRSRGFPSSCRTCTISPVLGVHIHLKIWWPRITLSWRIIDWGACHLRCCRLQLIFVHVWLSRAIRAHNSTTKVFLYNYYTFLSLHDSDHEGVVRIFVALFCELDSSGNRTPGSRFYSDLLDTSVCIHQLVLKRRQSARLLV